MGKNFVLWAAIISICLHAAITSLPLFSQRPSPPVQRGSKIEVKYTPTTPSYTKSVGQIKFDRTGYVYGGERVFDVTYYNPHRGGRNCDYNCKDTASGLVIIGDDGKNITDCWFNGKTGCAACDFSMPFGTIIVLDVNGEEILLVCMDRFGRPNGLDILYDDGYRKEKDPYKPPITSGGKKIHGKYKGKIYYPPQPYN